MSRFPLSAVLAFPLLLLSTAPASADEASVGHVYDTVDRVESGPDRITITGIIAGQSAPTTLTYFVDAHGAGDPAGRCDRYALLAMSRPGKYQFGTVLFGTFGLTTFTCSLATRTP